MDISDFLHFHPATHFHVITQPRDPSEMKFGFGKGVVKKRVKD